MPVTSVKKVISGGQIGADIAALRVAHDLGIPTGGWCPAGWRNAYGSNEPEFRKYGLRCHRSHNYPPRTFANVKDSDGTIRFAISFNSPGEKCTLRAIVKYGRPHFDVHISLSPDAPNHFTVAPMPAVARRWVEDNGIKTLNVAGNAKEFLEPVVGQYLLLMLTNGRKL